ncbi:MAG: fumarylacetoacetate hydrolase family protein [Acidimicrobiaceae bacterium]|nr:fumarylacetoacetate hydrolase family protein [Acidimicrobiaceae bacterium]
MKLVSYRWRGDEHLGALDVDAGVLFEVAGLTAAPPGQKLAYLIARSASDSAASIETSTDPVPLSSVEVIAPLPRPTRDIFCVGRNYRDHSSEFTRSGYDASAGDDTVDVPAQPIFFSKTAGSVVGPGATIDPHRTLTSSLDYEAELGVIIGRGGRGISATEAWEHIWGYTLINDITAREIQRDRTQWFLGKSLDTFCPMGPWAVSADEVEAANLTIECHVNGEVRQHANTKDLIFDIPTLIADLSAGITLRAGDVIATGTPAGVGMGFSPPRFLAPGDVVSVTATGLGVLENRVGS